MKKILITGACGQLGSELTNELRAIHGTEQVIASDISEPPAIIQNGPFEHLDVLDRPGIEEIIDKHEIDTVYHLAALLSATAEKNISLAWRLNMDGLLKVLDIAKEKSLHRIFWPSSIAVFGPDARKEKTPQSGACNPATVYGISKLAGEQWCAYFHKKFGVDVRSLRYPGLIGYKSLPGGGTTDYAVDIFHKAIDDEPFECFLDEHTALPMMYMPDAVKATIDLMQAPPENITVRTSYNVSGFSFTPGEIASSIRAKIPEFSISYKPDHRQAIAESWPDSIDDTPARNDWNWKPAFDLKEMTTDILKNLPAYRNVKTT